MTQQDATSLEFIVGCKVLERFRRGNAERRAQGERLAAAIRRIDESHIGPVQLRGESVLALLPKPAELQRECPPSLRTVLRHLKVIRTVRRLGKP
jgi:hypothetical protein